MLRRKFCKSVGVATAGSMVIHPFTIHSKSHERRSFDDSKLGVALVGLGYYATHKLAVGLEETKHCELRGIVTGSPEKIPQWQDKYGIPEQNIYNYENFDEIADNESIDIIYVVLPNAMHADYVIRGANAGKHVMCEKPFDINAERAERAVEACKQAGVLLQIGYRCQYDLAHKEIISMGEERRLGQIKEIRSAHSFYGVQGSNWRYTDKKLAGGGPLMDVGIYSINAARYATGLEPSAVWARTFNTHKDLMDGMEETIVYGLEFPDGSVASMSSSYAARANFFDVSAERGNYGLEPAFGYSGATAYIQERTLDLPKFNQQAVQMDAFAKNIMDGTEVVASGEEGLKDMIVIDALYESARQDGQVVQINN